MYRLLFAAAAICAAPAAAFAADSDGTDHPLLPRYPEAEIRSYRASSLDEILIPTQAIADEENPAGEHLEGTVTHIDYRITPAIGALGVQRHYEAILRDSGFETLFACSHVDQCGRDMASLILNSGEVAPQGFADGIFTDELRVLVARRGSDTILLHMVEGPDRTQVYQAVVEDGMAAPH